MNDNNGAPIVMPVTPYGGGYSNGGFGGFGDMGSGWWIILLLICLGGWGNGFGGFGGMGGGAFPWMMAGQGNTNNDIQRGFDQAAVVSGINGIQNSITSGFGDVATALCGGFGTVNSNIANGFAQAEIGANTRQMANMNQIFGLQSALQNCCCENRLATANQTATILAENCADRAAISDGIRDIISNQTANTQRILDVLCQDKLDSKNEKLLELQNSLNMANLAASQSAQTQQILAALTTVTPAVAVKSAA